jgi:hypothetical protein
LKISWGSEECVPPYEEALRRDERGIKNIFGKTLED